MGQDAVTATAVRNEPHFERYVFMKRFVWALVLILASVIGPALARDRLFVTPYGAVASDVLAAFDAEIVPCVGAIASSDVCFVVAVAAPTALAARLEGVIEAYRPAGLTAGAWRAANGVWSLTLRFGSGRYGELEVYLSETGSSSVRGALVFVGP